MAVSISVSPLALDNLAAELHKTMQLATSVADEDENVITDTYQKINEVLSNAIAREDIAKNKYDNACIELQIALDNAYSLDEDGNTVYTPVPQQLYTEVSRTEMEYNEAIKIHREIELLLENYKHNVTLLTKKQSENIQSYNSLVNRGIAFIEAYASCVRKSDSYIVAMSNPIPKMSFNTGNFSNSTTSGNGPVRMNNAVDFSSVAKFEIEFEDFVGLYNYLGNAIKIGNLNTRKDLNDAIRNEWQTLAKDQLVKMINKDAAFAKIFSESTGINVGNEMSLSILNNELSRHGLTLHETIDCKNILLVPTAIHKAYSHHGGVSTMLDTLLSASFRNYVISKLST